MARRLRQAVRISTSTIPSMRPWCCARGDARIASELIDQPPVDRRQRLGLQVDRRHHELRLAAGRANQRDSFQWWL